MAAGTTDPKPDAFGLGLPAAELSPSELALDRLDSAWATCAAGFRTGIRSGHRGEARNQPLLAVHTDLQARRAQFLRGDSLALLQAVAVCAEENLPMPRWLATAFVRELTKFTSTGGTAKSLDAVFASRQLPTQTEKAAAKARRDWELGVQLWRAVRAIATNHSGLDPALRTVLKAGRDGLEWGVGPTRARELVKMIDETQVELTSRRVKPLSQLWAKGRK